MGRGADRQIKAAFSTKRYASLSPLRDVVKLEGVIMSSGPKLFLSYSSAVMFLLLSAPAFAQAEPSAAGPAASGDDATYCRPPQDRTDSRMKGPKVCMKVGEWKKLYARGLDISADGQSTVPLGSPESMGTPNSLRPNP